MRAGLPKVVKDAQRLRAAIEEAFSRMEKRHKWVVGIDLRGTEMLVRLFRITVLGRFERGEQIFEDDPKGRPFPLVERRIL